MPNSYIYVVILCEGQSEESFVKNILAPYFEIKRIYVQPIVLGGVSHYANIRRELKRLGRNKSVVLTMMLDYYKLPQDVPGVSNGKKGSPAETAEYIENCIYKDLNNEIESPVFIPYIQMHEYEALLLSDVTEFGNCQGIENSMILELEKQVNMFETPEHVNNSEQTAPSKRILNIYPAYQKVTDGTIIAGSIGIEKMMTKCIHFSDWIKKIEGVI